MKHKTEWKILGDMDPGPNDSINIHDTGGKRHIGILDFRGWKFDYKEFIHFRFPFRFVLWIKMLTEIESK